ncbi:MAG: GAF domain-containing protein [Anaerolineae bacterium]|nr:GAF domain-containing protein [Anaerolineae bacterium]
MPTQDANQPNRDPLESIFDLLLPQLLTVLSPRWKHHSGYLELTDWQVLLETAVRAPQTLPTYLANLYPAESGWSYLLHDLELTLDAAKALPAPDVTDWQALADIQHRLLTAAAQSFSPKTKTPPAPNISSQLLSRLNQHVAASSDPDQMLDGMLALIQREFGYPCVNLFLLNAGRTALTLQHLAWDDSAPRPNDPISLSATAGIIGQVISSGQSVLLDQAAGPIDEALGPAWSDIQSRLCVPVAYNQNLVGVLDIESRQASAFSEYDRTVLQALADQLALAIEKVRLQRSQQRYAREEAFIIDTVNTLSTERDSTEVIKLMSQKIAHAVEAGACVICRVDEKDKTVTAIAEYTIPENNNPARTWRPINSPVSADDDPIGQRMLKEARPILSRAVANERAIWQKPLAGQGQWNTVMAIPFEIKPLVKGFVEIYDQNPQRHFSADDAKLCRVLATQTAMAIEQAHLFDQTIQRLSEMSLLYTMAQKISSSLDLEDVLNMIVTSLRQAIGCRACCIFLLDETGQQLEIKAADGLKPQWREAAKLKLGQGAAGRAAAEGRSVYLPDTQRDASYIFFDKDVKSLLVVPLQAQGKIIGTINVDDDRTHAFGPTQERLLTIAAAQAGITIENARLFTQISEERQQMQAIIQHMADGLLLIDSHGTIITCNPPLAMVLGVSPLQIIGKNVNDPHLHPNLISVTRPMTEHARTGVLATEVSIDTPHPRALQILTTPVTGHHKERFGEIRLIHDVTKERELDQLKDDFYSTISHELRTPLFSIQGFAQIMLEEESLDAPTRREFLNTIQRQALQLSEMVNNLLDLSKFDAGKMELVREPVALLNLLNQTVSKLQGFAHQQGIRLVTGLPKYLPPITGDSERLEQVLTNLIGNAIKFSEAGQMVLITAAENDAEVLVKVKDKGIGIPAEDLEHIFSRYYQATNKSERSAMGSGLGLHIAKKIIVGHQGKIWAESEAGQGSTFCFTLPRAGAS